MRPGQTPDAGAGLGAAPPFLGTGEQGAAKTSASRLLGAALFGRIKPGPEVNAVGQFPKVIETMLDVTPSHEDNP